MHTIIAVWLHITNASGSTSKLTVTSNGKEKSPMIQHHLAMLTASLVSVAILFINASSQIPVQDQCRYVNQTEPPQCPQTIGPPCPVCHLCNLYSVYFT